MKFGAQLAENAVPGWLHHYIEYNFMKKQLRVLEDQKAADAALLTAEAQSSVQTGYVADIGTLSAAAAARHHAKFVQLIESGALCVRVRCCGAAR